MAKACPECAKLAERVADLERLVEVFGKAPMLKPFWIIGQRELQERRQRADENPQPPAPTPIR